MMIEDVTSTCMHDEMKTIIRIFIRNSQVLRNLITSVSSIYTKRISICAKFKINSHFFTLHRWNFNRISILSVIMTFINCFVVRVKFNDYKLVVESICYDICERYSPNIRLKRNLVEHSKKTKSLGM